MGVMTAVAIGGLAISAASAAKSFSDAGKQKKAQKEAESAAAAAMAAARKKLDVNMYDSLGINKEAYELAQNAMLTQSAQATEAARESERGVAATAGAVQQAVNEGSADLRTQMGTELMGIQKTIAAEDANLQKLQANLDLGEAEGAQQAAADAQKASAAAMSQGFASATSAVQQGLNMVPLYQESQATKQLGKLEKNYNSAVAAGGMNKKFYDAKGTALPFQQAAALIAPDYGWGGAGIGTFNNNAFTDYMIGLGAKNLKSASGYNFK